MARMPQIPQTEFSPRPQGDVPRAALPSVEASTAGAREAAGVLGNMGDMAAHYEKERQHALDQKQEILDTVNATKAVGEYRDKTNGLLAQFQTQQLEDPLNVEARGKLSVALQQEASRAVADPKHNGNVAGKLVQQLAHDNNRALVDWDHWGQSRATVLAKSDLTQFELTSAPRAGTAYSPQALERQMKEAHEGVNGMTGLDALYDKLSHDPAKAKHDYDVKTVTGWAEKQLATPGGAFEALAAINDPKGLIRRTLDPKAVESLAKKATAAFAGGGVSAELTSLAKAHQDISSVLSLAAANDPKYMDASFAKRAEIQQDIATTEANTTHLPASSREAKLGTLRTNLEILDTIDMMHLRQPGIFKSKVDAKVTADILTRAKAPFMKPDTAIGDHLNEMLQLRLDAAAAHQMGTLSTTDYKTVETKLQLAIPKAQAAQSTGFLLSIFGHDIDFMDTIQAGNRRIDELMHSKTSPYGELSLPQQNVALSMYYDKLNGMHKHKDGAPAATKESVRAAAEDAVRFAAGAKK